MTSLVDLFPNVLRKGCRRELLLLAICSICCLLGFSLVTEVCAAHFFHSLPPCFIGLCSCLLYREGCTCCSCWTIMSAVEPLYSSFPSASQSASAGCMVSELEQFFCGLREAAFADCLVPIGSERFYKNITDMIGYRPNPFMKYCWTYITPFMCLVSILSEMSLSAWWSSVGNKEIVAPHSARC